MNQTRRPAVFIPTMYFAEGLPYTIVMVMSGIFFKSLGADNIFIGLTSFLSLPWILKFAWSPLVDFYSTKRNWIVIAEFVLAVLILGIAGVAYMSGHIPFASMIAFAVAILAVTALASATHDVSIDAFYLDVLNDEQKSLYVGIRNTAYRIAAIFGSGFMVFLAGKLGETAGLGAGWATAFAVCALAMLVCGIFHNFYLPRLDPPRTVGCGEHVPPELVAPPPSRNYLNAILTYFKQPGIAAIIAFILVFRLGDALMLKQAPNFLLDPPAKNGLGIAVADMGMIAGTVGVLALLIGGILASWLISRDGLKKWIWPLAVIQNIAILLYWMLAQWPSTFAVHSPMFSNPYLPAVYVINSAEQFAYGMGVAAYTCFLLTTVRSEYKAAHYATATAFMATGVMVPGAISGYLYQYMGYANFFLLSFFASVPGLVAMCFLPMWKEQATPVGQTAAAAPAPPSVKPDQVGSKS